jgi:tetratricopeptide (TPR) repeat protein
MLGNWDAALASRRRLRSSDLTRCIELNPNQPEPYNNRGVVLAQKGEYPAAMLDFGKAIGMKPQYAEAHFNLARINAFLARCSPIHSGSCDLASAHLKEAMALQPAYRQVARTVGDFDACKGQPGFTVEL